jgi:UDP-glucose 4-epimerase
LDNKVLVTGGAGYIGSHTVWELKRQGYDVTVLDNLSTGHKWAVKDTELVVGDVRDIHLLHSLFEKHAYQAVIHFAAKSIVADSIKRPLEYYDNNVMGSQNLISAVIQHDIPNFVFSSTAAVYGEPQDDVISESHPTDPINPYGKSKLMVETILQDAAASYGLNVIAFRYFNAAGANPQANLGEVHEPETHLIPNILLSAIDNQANGAVKVFGDDYETNDGTCIRDYVHVSDLARAHTEAIQFLNSNPGQHVFNLGSQLGYSVLEVINACERALGRDITYEVSERRAGDPSILIADSTAVQNAMNWEATQDIAQIVSDAASFMSHRT